MTPVLRAASDLQLEMILNPGRPTSAGLTAAATAELMPYAKGPLSFLRARQTLFGDAFAALGCVVVGDHARVARIVSEPQRRSSYVGVYPMLAETYPEGFLLFADDDDSPMTTFRTSK